MTLPSSPHRSGRRLAIGATVALITTVCVGVGALSVTGEPPGQRLPDGSRLALLGMAYGAPATARTGALLPRVFTQLFGITGDFASSRAVLLNPAPGELMVGMAHTGLDPRRTLPYYFEVRDDRGGRTVLWPDAREVYQFPDSELSALSFPTFPRRGKVLQFQVHSLAPNQHWYPSAQFQLPNPAHGPFPTWTPDPAGTVVSAGDLSVSVLGIAAGIPLSRGGRLLFPIPPELGGYTRIRVQVERHGSPAVDWEPIAVVLSDPTGNREEPLVGASQHPNERETDLLLNTQLVPSEPIWQADVELSRRSGFAPGEEATFRGVVIPASGKLPCRNQVAKLAGGTIELQQASVGKKRDRVTGFASTHLLWVRWVLPSAPGYRLRVTRIVDQRGKVVPFRYRLQPEPGMRTVGQEISSPAYLAPLPGTKSVDVTVAASRGRFARFTTALAPVKR